MIHLIRVGCVGSVGRFRSADGSAVPRGLQVVVRTKRGLELGEVLATDAEAAPLEADGPLLRRATESDRLLQERLERRRDQAYKSCVELLADRGSSSVLVDAELLFDGRGLYFYFLGEVDPTADQLTAELARAYDAEARIGAFAETLAEGCGPGCGTEDAVNGCGAPGSCSTCSVASACGLRADRSATTP